jgi:hypothetical protein
MGEILLKVKRILSVVLGAFKTQIEDGSITVGNSKKLENKTLEEITYLLTQQFESVNSKLDGISKILDEEKENTLKLDIADIDINGATVKELVLELVKNQRKINRKINIISDVTISLK